MSKRVDSVSKKPLKSKRSAETVEISSSVSSWWDVWTVSGDLSLATSFSKDRKSANIWTSFQVLLQSGDRCTRMMVDTDKNSKDRWRLEFDSHRSCAAGLVADFCKSFLRGKDQFWENKQEPQRAEMTWVLSINVNLRYGDVRKPCLPFIIWRWDGRNQSK